MIGGPDLAVNNVEPDEFLAFVSGRSGDSSSTATKTLPRG